MERSTVWMKMNAEFDALRKILAQTHPTRAELEMLEICAVLAFLIRESQKWQGREEVPFYERGSLLEAVFADDAEAILKAADSILGGKSNPVSITVDYLT